jgi:translation initiation factor 3 subunit M
MPPSASSPSASSTLVNVAEDAELRLVRLLCSPPQGPASVSDQFLPTCQQCIAMGDAAQLLQTIVQEKAAIQALMELPSTEEAVSVVSLLAALLDRVGEKDATAATSLVHALAEAMVQRGTATGTGAGGSDVTRTVTLLSTLYNMRANPMEKCRLLVRMMQLAGTSSSSTTTAESGATTTSPTSTPPMSILDPTLPFGKLLLGSPEPLLVTWLNTWKVPVAERRAAYAAAAQGATTAATRQRFYIYLVESYNNKNSKEQDVLDATALSYARETALGAIRDPVTWIVQQRQLLSCRAIQALTTSTTPHDPVLVELLTLFQEGTLQEYSTFLQKQQQNGGGSTGLLLQQVWNLDPTKCLRFMRILTLCSLAADQESIPYSVVASTLLGPDTTGTTPDDKQVEQWVIAAVSSGLLSAKMDQLNKMVIVERCVVRKFDMDQWKVLQGRLHLWKSNVEGILQAYQQASASMQQSVSAAE